MRIERLGERAAIVRQLPCEPYLVARRLNDSAALPLIEAVASYETLGLYFDSYVEDISTLESTVASAIAIGQTDHSERLVQIPVCYELGEDLASCAQRLEIDSESLINLHLGRQYRCFAVGFSPGFGYLGYLDDSLSLPRLPSPRKRVEPGSVGITGRQTAVYPSATPGGWNLIGRSPVELVNVEDCYFPLEAGDQVAFFRIDEAEFARLKGERL